MARPLTDGPLKYVKEKPYHRITWDSINPFPDSPLVSTIYIMGSPGCGKSRFLGRVAQETEGRSRLVLESGVWDLMQAEMGAYAERTGGGIDLDFDPPNIDGLDPSMSSHSPFSGNKIWALAIDGTLYRRELAFERYGRDKIDEGLRTGNIEYVEIGDGEFVSNAPYTGFGASAYRDMLEVDGRVLRSGGKSGFPDYLFIVDGQGNLHQLISIPGHRSLESVMANGSIPKLEMPNMILYFIDPKIEDFDRGGEGNYAMRNAHKHWRDMLRLEEEGIPVNWFISKTPFKDLVAARKRIRETYAAPEFEELLAELDCIGPWDSFTFPRSTVLDLLKFLKIELAK